MPQHRVDVAGDLRPVLGADVPAAAEIIGRDIVGRTISGVDRGQNVDRGGDLRAGGQEAEGTSTQLTDSSLPGLTRQSTRRDVDARVEPGHDEEARIAKGNAIKSVNGPAGSWGLRG